MRKMERFQLERIAIDLEGHEIADTMSGAIDIMDYMFEQVGFPTEEEWRDFLRYFNIVVNARQRLINTKNK